MKTLTKFKKCQIHNCNGIALYYNPSSKLKYCQDCYDRLGGKIIHQSADIPNGIFEKSTRLVKIDYGFNIMDVKI